MIAIWSSVEPLCPSTFISNQMKGKVVSPSTAKGHLDSHNQLEQSNLRTIPQYNPGALHQVLVHAVPDSLMPPHLSNHLFKPFPAFHSCPSSSSNPWTPPPTNDPDISLLFGPGTYFAHHWGHICTITSALQESTLPTFPKEFSSPLRDGELKGNTVTVLLSVSRGI